jgi:hypothetical protein
VRKSRWAPPLDELDVRGSTSTAEPHAVTCGAGTALATIGLGGHLAYALDRDAVSRGAAVQRLAAGTAPGGPLDGGDGCSTSARVIVPPGPEGRNRR